MDMATIMVALASLALAHVCALLGLRLRLRWRVRHEQVQSRHLTDLTTVLDAGGRIELDEERGEGRRLSVKIVRVASKPGRRTTR
ncbi:hypothetical protein AB0C27_53680 [Nonomuraea sp. NPDC048882]|uniref:hypothetical protein n=1 Tax=Nonomuraea sp. NPDC048882 TaxID=3154347 RepID=UPI0033CA6273